MDKFIPLVLEASRLITRTNPHGWGRVNCPLCIYRVGTPDPHRGLGIHLTTGVYNCFRCKSKGRVILGNASRVYSPQIAHRATEEGHRYLGPPGDYRPLTGVSGVSGAMQYLHSRGVDAQTIAEAKIGAVTWIGYQSVDAEGRECLRRIVGDRVVVPILDRRNDEKRWLGWVARVWEPVYGDDPFDQALATAASKSCGRNKKLKYFSCPGMNRANLIWNTAALYVESEDPVMVVEGIFDGLPYWPDCVALLGKPSDGQERLLSKATRPIVVVLDGDAWLEGEMLSLRLNMRGARSWSVKLPPERDPGDLDPALVEKMISSTRPR